MVLHRQRERPTAKATWAFSNGTPADSSSVVALLERYREMNASDVARKATAGSLDFSRPTGRARLVDAHGKPLLQLLFDSSATGVWVRRDSGGPVFKIEAYAFGSMAPAESTLKAKRPKK